MTRYAVDKVLWTYAREAEFRVAFDAGPARALAEFELDASEKAALASRDIRAIFLLGAHPFLVYSFAIVLNKGWTFEFMQDYVGRLKGIEPGNIET